MFKIIDFLYYLFFFTISMNVAKTDVKALSVHNVEISSDKKKLWKVDGGSSRSPADNFPDLHLEKWMRMLQI